MPKRGENIYKRKDGRWEGRYIRGRSPSGRAEYGYVYAGSYRECRAKRQKCLDACREAPVAASSLTLNQAAERFLADKQDDLKRSTLARYTYVLKRYILPVFGAVLLSQLTANQISEFLRRLQKNGLSGKSARDVGVLLKSILRYSAKKLDCPSPGMTVELPAYRRKQIDIFYPDEIQRLAQMIMDEPTTTGIGILLTLNTGLRLGELCALQYKDIDLRNGVVHVRKTVQRIRSGDRTSLMVLPPKSDSARRTIPLPGDMAALLQKLVQSHPNGENYLLTGKNVPMEPRTMQYQYRALLKAAGIPYRNFHTLRHTYASRCVERGIDVKSLSEMLGHADVRTTLQVYVHSSLDDLEQHALKLLHAKTGAAIARDVFGVDDAVYRAIYWHTTGHPNMTKLEKIIYLADYIEPSRDFPGVEDLRRAVHADLDRGLLKALDDSIRDMQQWGNPVHHNTLDARDYLLRGKQI